MVGFNGGFYDLSVIRKFFFKSLLGRDELSFFCVIKKNNWFLLLALATLRFNGSSQFLTAGTSLDQFLKAYGVTAKKIFPYGYLVSFDKLYEITSLFNFFAYLRNDIALESDFKKIVDNGGDRSNPKRPKTGEENYELIKQLWNNENFETMRDFLKNYNCLDFEPLHEAVKNLIQFYKHEKSDLLKNTHIEWCC